MKVKYILFFLLIACSKLNAQNQIDPFIDPGCEGCLKYWNDADNDNYGVPPFTWAMPGQLTTNYTLYNPSFADCDDSDPQITLMTYYKDQDQDGFGDPFDYITDSCTSPSSVWVANDLDCDDQNPSINPNMNWYVDNDNDGFGSMIILIQQCDQPVGGVNNNLDCDDSNGSIGQAKNWYADLDSDGYGDPNSTPILSCINPGSNYIDNNLDSCPLVYGTILGCVVPPSNSNFSEENYVMSIKPRVAVTQTQQIGNTDDVLIDITYFDGLGREKQKINVNQSGNNGNIITPIEYDSMDRQIKQYLPYVSSSQNLDYIPTALTDQAAYYSIGSPSFDATSYPYVQKEYETSAVDRIIKQSAPGNDWSFSSGHETKFKYESNIANEVRKYKVDYSSDDSTRLGVNGFYAANQLYKVVTKNENWSVADGLNNTTQEFKDKEGRIVLKRTFNTSINIPQTLETYNTFYIYNELDNLSYVIPPVASDAIDSFYNITQTSVAKNYPWTALAAGTGELAEEYNKLFVEYKNELIENADLYTKYGGQGGFTISTNSNGEPVLNINMNTIDAMELKTGKIVSLKEFGDFKDTELGRIKGDDYEYVFYIKENVLMIDGKGKLNSITTNFNGNVKLVYNTNYPWASLTNIKPEEEKTYLELYNNIDNELVISSQIENPYKARGGINITINENDQVGIDLNISSDTPLSFKNGMVIPLKIERRLKDQELFTVSSNEYKYIFSIKENSLYIEGEGNFISINQLKIAQCCPPVAQNILIPQDILEGLCYIYHYDKRNRLVEKKIPGQGWQYIVYDKLNRAVLTQDANMRAMNKWLFTKYDAFGRPSYGGEIIYTSPSGNINISLRLELQSLIDNASFLYENRTSSPIQNSGINVNYTDLTFPKNNSPNVSNYRIYTVNYYDDYDFQPYGININIPVTTHYSDQINTNVKSLATGTLIKVLDGSTGWIINLTGYDNLSRPIWIKSSNSYLQTTDITESKIDFNGKALETYNTHSKAGIISNLVTINKFTYDHADRLLKQTQKIGNHSDELITYNEYDQLGNIIHKKVGGNDVTSPNFNATLALQTIDYSYNIRGWLKALNNPDVNLTDQLFALKLNYNSPQLGANPLFNGNISESSWRSISDNKKRNYKYTYDFLHRITDADYVGNYQLVQNNSQIENYSENNIQYDKNGNITDLDRYGLKSDAIIIDKIDEMHYVYEPRSNKLSQVVDYATQDAGFKDLNASDNIDYTYDINGNVTKDVNKDITSIQYNFLNLPTKIVFNGADSDYSPTPKTIKYVYDAMGRKQEKIVINRIQFGGNWLPITTDYTQYVGKCVYRNNALEFVGHPEGYANYESGLFSYVYQYKDHLGNVRLSYKKNESTGNLDIIEESNYYPFGLNHKGYNNSYNPIGNDIAQKYKYNGKEFQDELGINFYDYGARNYDPAIGRWMNIDPLAENSRRWTPYNYAYNNPVYFIDPDGMQAKDHWRLNESGKLELVKLTNDKFNVFFDEKGKKLFQTNQPANEFTKKEWAGKTDEYINKINTVFTEIAKEPVVFNKMEERAQETGFDSKYTTVEGMKDSGNEALDRGPIKALVGLIPALITMSSTYFTVGTGPGLSSIKDVASAVYTANTSTDVKKDAPSLLERAKDNMSQFWQNLKYQFNNASSQIPRY